MVLGITPNTKFVYSLNALSFQTMHDKRGH